MKKHEERSRGEDLLAQVLEECLEEDLSFVPPEGEIARTHRFSEDFEQAMQRLLTEWSETSKKKEIQRHFSPRFGQWAACVLIFCVCGWLFYQVGGQIGDSGSGMEGAADTAAEAPASDEAFDMGDTEATEAASEEEAAADDDGADTGSEEQNYCGQTVYRAEKQDVPKQLQGVTAQVNCPVLDEDNPVLMLTIGNTGEEAVRYQNRYDLEVRLSDGWYRILSESEEEGTWMTLEAGMAVDEEIDLSLYKIDYEAGQYRLVTHTEQGLIGVEFTFAEMFEKTMEKQEE